MSTAALELLISLKDEASAGLSAIGGGLTSMAGLAAAGGLALTGAVVGVGAAAFDMASDVNQAENDMQAAHQTRRSARPRPPRSRCAIRSART